MLIIWQELRGIFADAWDVIVSICKALFVGIVANYPLIIIGSAGFGIGLPLTVISFLGMLDSLFRPVTAIVFPDRPQGPDNILAYLLMFLVGAGIMWLTTLLFERVDKRMAGKPKDEDQPHPTSTESEA